MGDVMCGWCSNVNPSQKYSFQLTVTTFRRRREAVNENRGEGRGGFKLLVTNRVDRVEFVNQNYNFVSNFLAFYCVLAL